MSQGQRTKARCLIEIFPPHTSDMPEKDLANDFSLRKTALNNLYASSNTCMVTWSMVKEERLLIESLQNGIADFKDLTEDLKPYQ